MEQNPNLATFLQKISLPCKDPQLLRQAFTHRSYLNENPDCPRATSDNLQPFGDQLLELVVAEHLYRHHPNSEGDLSHARNTLLSKAALAQVAREIGLEPYLFLGRGEAASSNRNVRQTILARSFQALVAAIYLDAGYATAYQFTLRCLGPKIPEDPTTERLIDPKNRFQNMAWQHERAKPYYRTLNVEGPDHDRHWTVGLFLRQELVATGEGQRIREAQVQAAEQGLRRKGWLPSSSCEKDETAPETERPPPSSQTLNRRPGERRGSGDLAGEQPANLAELQGRLGIVFQDGNLVRQALTHPSLVSERPDWPCEDYQRLEFLGDRVLGCVITEHWYQCCPDRPEELDRMRQILLTGRLLARVADELNLRSYLYLGRGEANSTDAKAKQHLGADALEALVAAMYLDAGYAAAQQFTTTWLLPKLNVVAPPKSKPDRWWQLQSEARQRGGAKATYRLLATTGPDHDRRYTVGIYLDGELIANATDQRKRGARGKAARCVLELKGWLEPSTE